MLLSKNSLYPEEVATYLPDNSEIITYKNKFENDFLYNVNDNEKVLMRKIYFSKL